MANYAVKSSDLISVADAIRTKGGTSASLAFPSGFVSAIGDIPTGGSSPLVSGTFTGSASEKGSAKSITIPYSGSGYPVAILIYPTGGGYNSNTAIYSSTQLKAMVTFMAIKGDTSLTPDYTNNAIQNFAFVMASYKNNSSQYDSYAGTSPAKNTTLYYRFTASGGSATSVARFYNSATNMAVYIAPDGGSEYGFLAGQEYTYQILYSS